MKRFLLLIFALLSATLIFAQNTAKPQPAYPFSDVTLSSPDLLGLKNPNPGNTTYAFSGTTIQDGADRLFAIQNTDGGWGWPVTGASALNTIGPITKGLAEAYKSTEDADHLTALTNAATFLLAKTNNFSPSDGYLAKVLDEIFTTTTYSTFVNTNFYGPLAASTYDRNGLGILYDTPSYILMIRNNRASWGQANMAAWDIGMGLVGAASCGVTGDELDYWIAGTKAEIDELDGEEYYDVIGLAGALYGLAFVDEEFDPTTGEHAAASNLQDLADILVTYQISNGGFAWNSNYVIPLDANEAIQETSYSILALSEVNRTAFITNILGAADYIESVQLANGGWANDQYYFEENNEVTGEALWGYTAAYLPAGGTVQNLTQGSWHLTIQEAINGAITGDVINVYPGTYNQDEANGYDPVTGGPGTSDFNIFVNKSVTIRGVDVTGVPIADYDDVAAYVIPKRNTPVSNLSTIFVQADNVTITGMDITGYPDPDNNYKTISVIGNNNTIKYCKLHNLDKVSCIYMYDPNYNAGTDVSHVQSYLFEGNYFDAGGINSAGIRFSSGAGWSGAVANRIITGNTIIGGAYGIEFVGPGGDPWDVYPVGAATISSNTFTGQDRGSVAAWGKYGVVVGYGTIDWDGIFTGNTFDKAVLTKTSGGSVQYFDVSTFYYIRGIYSAIQRYPINRVAQSGDIINIKPGNYIESATNCYLYDSQGPYVFGLFLPDEKSGISLVGVNNAGIPIANYNAVQANVQLNATNNFGPSGVFVEGDDITITGLNLYLDPAGDQNKTVEVIGENVIVKYCQLTDGNSLYINDWRYNTGTDVSHITKYWVEGNKFTLGTSLDICSGAGYSGPVADRKILNNYFDAGNWYWAMISFTGSDTGVPWFLYSVGGAVITGNTFVNGEQYIRHRGTVDNSQFNWNQYWNSNTFDKAVITLSDQPSFTPRIYQYISGSYTFTNVRRIGALIQPDITNVAQTGDVVLLGPGTYTEGNPQILINKTLSIVGANKITTIIKPAQNTGSSGDLRGWFFIGAGYTFNLSNVTLDGAGKLVNIGILCKSPGTIDNCILKNLGYNPSGPDYAGRGIAFYECNMTISNNNLSNIGRIGIYMYGSGVTNAAITNNIFTGKGDGNFLDYGIEVEGGAKATITGNNISDCRGIASVDGSGSAGFLGTTYFALGTQATIENNTFEDNSVDVHVGYSSSDGTTVAAHYNSFLGSTYAVVSTFPLVDATCNWYGTSVATDIAARISGNVSFLPFWTTSTGPCNGLGPVVNVTQSKSYMNIKPAVIEAAGNDVITVAAGTYTESGQIDINKNLTLTGATAATTIIKPADNTTLGGNVKSESFIYVDPAATVSFSKFTVDCAGKLVNHAIQSRGALTVDDCIIKNVYYNIYAGRGIVLYKGNNTVMNTSFTNIQRIGIHVRGNVETPNPVGTIQNITYTGKGAGDWLDYGIEYGGGGTGTVTNANISNCKGVTSNDGSTSAGILVTDYWGTGTSATITSSTLTNNTEGIAVGYDVGDLSTVVANYNKIYGNTAYGVSSTGVAVNATYNYWGDPAGPKHLVTNVCGLGNEVTDNVSYSPWYKTILMTTTSTGNTYKISGTIKYANNANTNLNGIIVTLKKTVGGAIVGTYNTDLTPGSYFFAGLTNDNYYLELSPTVPTVPPAPSPYTHGRWQTWGGVNSTDYLLVLRHAQGTAPLPANPPVVKIAANVKAPSTTAILVDDANLIRQAYLTNNPHLFDIDHWVFSGGATTYAPLTGIALDCKNETRNIVGLCAGDVNGSYIPPSGPKSEALPGLELISRGSIAAAGEIILPVKAEMDMELGAITLILDYDASLLNITGVTMPEQGNDAPFFSAENNVLQIGWASLDPVSVAMGETVLEIHAIVKNATSGMTSFTLNSSPLSELANGEGTVIEGARLAVADIGGTLSSNMISVYPNPAKDVLNIEYMMDQAGTFRAELSNAQGSIVKLTDNSSKAAGPQKEMLNVSSLPSGVYMLRVYTGTTINTQKIIINH